MCSTSQLGAALIEQQLIAQRDLERAEARQVLYGLDLSTNLIEVTNLDEARFTEIVSRLLGLKPAPVGALLGESEELRGVLSASAATKFGAYPLEKREGVVVIAVSQPLDEADERELGALFDSRIEQVFASSVRIREAISNGYRLPLDRRTLRAVAKLEGRPDPMPSIVPGPLSEAPGISALPRPASAPPIAQAPISVRPPIPPTRRVESAPPAAASIAPSASSALPRSTQTIRSEVVPARKSTPSSHKHHRGPYTTQLVGRDLREAKATSDVLGAFFDFAAQYFEYSALFAVHDDIAEGRDAAGPGLDRSQITAIGVPLDIPSLMSKVRGENHFVIESLASTGLDASLAKDLRRPIGAQVFLLPIAIRGRCVVIFYGDEGNDDVLLKEMGEVLGVAPLVANSLERILVQRKRATTKGTKAKPSPSPVAEDRSDSDDVETKRVFVPVSETQPKIDAKASPEEAAVDTPRIPSVRFSEPARSSAGSAKRSDIQEDDWDIPDDPMPDPSPPHTVRTSILDDEPSGTKGGNARPASRRT